MSELSRLHHHNTLASLCSSSKWDHALNNAKCKYKYMITIYVIICVVVHIIYAMLILKPAKDIADIAQSGEGPPRVPASRGAASRNPSPCHSRAPTPSRKASRSPAPTPQYACLRDVTNSRAWVHCRPFSRSRSSPFQHSRAGLFQP